MHGTAGLKAHSFKYYQAKEVSLNFLVLVILEMLKSINLLVMKALNCNSNLENR